MSDISRHADKCTFQLIHLVFQPFTIEIKPGKGISKLSRIHLSLLFLPIVEDIDVSYSV